MKTDFDISRVLYLVLILFTSDLNNRQKLMKFTLDFKYTFKIFSGGKFKFNVSNWVNKLKVSSLQVFYY